MASRRAIRHEVSGTGPAVQKLHRTAGAVREGNMSGRPESCRRPPDVRVAFSPGLAQALGLGDPRRPGQPEPADMHASNGAFDHADRNSYSAPNVRLSRLAGCSLPVTANICAKGCRPLVLTGDIFMKPSLPTPGPRGRRMDAPLHEHAVERPPADVPDNRPLSDGRVGRPGR